MFGNDIVGVKDPILLGFITSTSHNKSDVQNLIETPKNELQIIVKFHHEPIVNHDTIIYLLIR